MVSAGSQLSGVAVQIWGGSVIFDWGLVGSAVLHMPGKDALAPDRRTPLEGPLHNKLALLLALVRGNYIRKNSTTSRDGRI
jgi:hypothetical protein